MAQHIQLYRNLLGLLYNVTDINSRTTTYFHIIKTISNEGDIDITSDKAAFSCSLRC